MYYYSKKWKTWKATIDLKTCLRCRENHGKIYSISDYVFPEIPVHKKCRCSIQLLLACFAGSATNIGENGADWHLRHFGKLPKYYISKDDAKKLGWVSIKGNLGNVAPNKMLFGGIYYNDDRKLPHKNGRIWYEADINYSGGWRNGERIIFSNDGLIFVTYNHYKTFIEIF